MKTSLEIPDEIVRDLKVMAALEGRKLKDIVAESLHETIKKRNQVKRPGIRTIPPLSVEKIHRPDKGDLLEDMLDDRGHRY
ncbi:MAG: hypothetical protein JJT75_01405 [Opitutales bacterium]|nr:hypothetical protein [Opitutales bacterium]MCH8541628.1 hypothetical protein [Opitutales bacterium]